jgi:hypothetical protein
MENKETLYEALSGLVHTQRVQSGYTRQAAGPAVPVALSNAQKDQQTILLNKLQGVDIFDFNFRGWQKDIIDDLRRGNNIYVISSPGSGKTAPIMFYWAEKLGMNPSMFKSSSQNRQIDQLQKKLLNILENPSNLPKVLYLCPVRQLVYEIQNEFRLNFSKFIVDLINRTLLENSLIDITIFQRRIIDNITGVFKFNNFKNLIRQRAQNYSQMQRNMTAGNQSMANRFAKEIETINQQIINGLAKSIKQFIDRELVAIKTGVDPQLSKNAPITIAVYDSGYTAFKELSKGDIKLLIIDEAHKLQELSGDNNNDLERTIDSTYKIFEAFSKDQKDKQIVFLSGTVNPRAAKDLLDYLELCMKIKVKSLISTSVARNPSDVSVLPMDSLTNDNTLVNLLTNPKESNNAIILFSKKRIDNLIETALRKTQGHKYTASQIDKGILQTRTSSQYGINLDNLEKNDPRNIQRQTNIEGINTKEIIEKINKIPEVGEIRNETLLKCVLSGFGFIYNMDSIATTNAQKRSFGKDQQIVAKLFSEGKIKTIIATDAIGIGVNLKIKNMYVPNVIKFDGSKNSPLFISNASQLYNRVGRMAFNVSNIYTPSQYVDDIVTAISASNEKFDIRDTIKRHEKICKSKKFFASLLVSQQEMLKNKFDFSSFI